MADMQQRLELPDFQVVLHGSIDLEPVLRFSDANLKAPFERNLVRIFGREIPTSIQKFSIPAIKKGLDVVGLSQTGSGKTGAYIIPIVNQLLEQYVPPSIKVIQPQCLIVAPTRELALQICHDAEEMTKGTMVLCGSVYGGNSVRGQLSRISAKGVHILTATPGRLYNHFRNKQIDLSELRTIVVDEADHMLECDFKLIKNIFGQASFPTKGAQILFYSATSSIKMETKAKELMKENQRVTIEYGKIGRANDEIEQVFFDTPEGDKLMKLIELLNADKDKALIFVNTKERSEIIMAHLTSANLAAENICSLMEQVEREASLEKLRKNEIKCLVATDVACRGLHIPGPLHVINYQLPKMGTEFDRIRAYVHRIGRTGRMGDRGRATSFFSEMQDATLGPSLYLQLIDRSQMIPDCIMKYKTDASYVPRGTTSGDRNFSRRRGPRLPKEAKSSTKPQPAASEAAQPKAAGPGAAEIAQLASNFTRTVAL